MIASPRQGDEEDGPPEGMTLLGLQPRVLDWGEPVPPPGVVIEAVDLGVTPGGWGYLVARLAPVPPAWPAAMPVGMVLRVRRLILAAGMDTPSRFGDDGWLLLSDEREASDIAALLLRPTGVHFVNHARHRRFADRWPSRLQQLNAFLQEQGLPATATVFDEDLVLELYGIRPCRDLRFLTLGEPLRPAPPFVANDAQLVHHGLDKASLVENPRYHLQVEGLRFVSFDRVRRFKLSRGRLVDHNDLAMMRALEAGAPWRLALGGYLDGGLVLLQRLRRLGRWVARRLTGPSRRRDGVSPRRR
ncbi:hypothetical protein [Halomonas beimenensis]|uniref:Uncharacterized protein n=1 Tax=Halomonas beimenensis TaxID=475662 RepID=A0A291P723_9GAMM|nr:hypothetical protein [Halomonas beimenensis]ATJ82694.1 hypothetical protein BEI_1707 [Halomonas beimenensis]